MNQELDRIFPKWLYWLALFGVGCLGFSIFFYWQKIPGPVSTDPQYWGFFGDYLGGVLNPIFGLLTLVVVIHAVFLQSKELKNSVDELRNSSNAMQEQAGALKKQNFESTLFQMLHLHNDIVSSLEVWRSRFTRDGITYDHIKGREAIKFLVDVLTNILEDDHALSELHRMNKSYGTFYEEYQHSIGHYFRFLYNIFKFIDNSDTKNKKFYANLIRAQLSTQELILLFYNCLSSQGLEKFKPLIEKYAILKTLPLKEFKGSGLRPEYANSAYGHNLN